MKKTLPFKILSILVSALLILSTAGCSLESVYKTASNVNLESIIKDYEKNNDMESLAKIICYAFDSFDFEMLNRYGYDFFFPKSESDKEVLITTFNDTLYEIGDNFTKEDVSSLYDFALWSYIYSFVIDYETLEVRKYDDIEEKIGEVYPECFALLMERNSDYLIATSVIELAFDTNTFPKDFLDILNLYAMNKSQDIAEAVYGYGVRIAFRMDSVNESNEWFFYRVLTHFNYDEIDSDVIIKSPSADGKLHGEYTIEELKTIMDSFTESNDSDYEDVVTVFSTLPKEFSNGRYYTMNYYMGDYIISFYGSPIFCMTITEKETGSIIYCRCKDAETIGDKAHYSWEGFKSKNIE